MIQPQLQWASVNRAIMYRVYSPANTTVPLDDASPVRNKDIIELVHVRTDKLLNSHDVAAPLTPANQEIAGYINYSAKFIPYLHWKIVSHGTHVYHIVLTGDYVCVCVCVS